MKFKSNNQRKAVMTKLSQMRNKAGIQFIPTEEKYTVNKYLKTQKAKLRFIDAFPKSEAYPLAVAQRVDYSIKNENLKKQGIESIPISMVKGKNIDSGSHFFDEDTKKFFASREESPAFTNSKAKLAYFVTSEKSGFNDPTRTFTVRSYDKKSAKIDTVGDFNGFSTRGNAIKAAKELAKK